jgi:YbbR domain-containing protein
VSFLPGVLTRNWRLKLAAFGAAVFLWAVVRAEPGSTTAVLSAPVIVEVGNPEWTLAGPPQPASVDVHLSGPGGEATRVRQEQIAVRIPMGEVTSRDTVVQLRRDWVPTEGSVVVSEIIPTRVQLTFEESVSRPVPVALQTRGSLPDDLALAQALNVTPSVVTVRGPASRVEGLDSLVLEPLDLSEVDESGVVPLQIDTTGLSGLAFTTTRASVGIRVEPAREESIPGVPVVVDSLPQGADEDEVSVEPAVVRVTLVGGQTRVSQVAAPELRAHVRPGAVQGMVPGEVRTVRPVLEGIPDLVEARITPDSVRVRRAPEGGDGDASDNGESDAPAPGSEAPRPEGPGSAVTQDPARAGSGSEP